ncbi:MAG TPA: sulfatase-like hydrolase/transferase [Arachidicoccus soli]|nr:sulfatase-like hydrolase/transferase [Arachidicoccus soli]
MNLLKFFKGLIASLILFGFCSQKSFAQKETKRPNVIFILVDDQGYGDLGVFFQNQRAKEGKPYERTPFLDKLAASGAMLTQQYAPAPVCAPSRASLMLGVSQGHSNVRDNEFDRAIDSNYTMASTMHTLGYTTIAIGKWGLQGAKPWDKNGDEWFARPTNRGFDSFFGYMRHMDGHEHYPKEGLYYNKKQVEVWDNGKNITPELDKCYTADLWTAYAKKWITSHEESKDKSQPFFMYLAYETPHAVLELPTQAYPAGGGLHGGMQWLGTPGHMITTASGTPDSYVNPDYVNATYDDDDNPATPKVPWPDTYKRYATANRRLDYAVGDLVQLLKDLKIDDNTIIVYTSDNGPSIESYLPKGYVANHPTFFGSYGPFDGIKRDDWEGGVRMPTIAVWPGHIPAGTVDKTPSISYDWTPTFIDAASGLPAPERLDGVSLLPQLTGKGTQRQSLIYNEYFFPGRTPSFKEFAPNHRGRKMFQMQMLRLGDFVGVRYNIKAASDSFEIYNVVKDPQQTNNLALKPQTPISAAERKTMNVEGIKNIGALQTYMHARVLQVRRPEEWAPRPYDTTLVPSVEAEVKTGVDWKIFRGNYPWLPQVATLKASSQGHSPLPDISLIKNEEDALLYCNGYILVPKDGQYTFYLNADAKAFLRIHDMQMIDADFNYQPGEQKHATVLLKAGLHPFRLYYYKKKEDKTNLNFEWSGPGIDKQTVAPNAFFRQK